MNAASCLDFISARGVDAYSAAPRSAVPAVPSREVARLGTRRGHHDSPRKMELVATLESHLGVRLRDPEIPLETVDDVIGWVNANVRESA